MIAIVWWRKRVPIFLQLLLSAWVFGCLIEPTEAFTHHSLPSLQFRRLNTATTALFATCRICRKSYSPVAEDEDANICIRHPGTLRGESPRKSNWEDASIDNTQLVFTYTCCGAGEGSEGCVKEKHKSYDDP